MNAEEVRIDLELPVVEHAPTLARRAVRELAGRLDGTGADVELVVSELVTNAVVHAGLRAGDSVHLRVSVAGDHLLIEVDDRGVRTDRQRAITARVRRPDSAGAGLGLLIVERLADEWERRGRSYPVWMRLDASH